MLPPARLLAAALVAAAVLAPGSALAAPPNDGWEAPGAFEWYSGQRNTVASERQATAELHEATPDAGVRRCLGPTSFERTAWYAVPATGNAREITVEAVGRTAEAIDLAAFVQTGPTVAPRAANACAGRGVYGDDATEDRTTALRVRVPAWYQVLVQVGRRGAAGVPEDESVLLTLEELSMTPLAMPAGDRASRTTPRIGRSGRSRVTLAGATTSTEDPAVPACPAAAGVWRRVKPPARGGWTFTATGADAGALTVFAGARPRDTNLLACVDREGSGPLVVPIAARTRRMLWVRVGTDRPNSGSTAELTFRKRRRGDRVSGGACLGSATGRVSGGPAARSRAISFHNRRRAFELALRATRGPVCAARIELLGPGGLVYARGDAAALRARSELVLLQRVRRLRRGLYRLRVQATRLGGLRRPVPSTVRFRLR